MSEINVRSKTHKEETIEGACDYKQICWRKKNASGGHHTSHPHNDVRQIPSLGLSWRCLTQAAHPSSTLAALSTRRGHLLLVPYLLLVSGPPWTSQTGTGQLMLVFRQLFCWRNDLLWCDLGGLVGYKN